MANHRIVEIPASNLKKRMTEILYEKGYILKYKFEDDNKQGVIKIALKYDANTKQPAIVIAASGMCQGGRVVNYLKALLSDPAHQVVFVGYQARGTLGEAIQKYGSGSGYVEIEGESISIGAEIITLSGYSAHADKLGLLNFVTRMRHKPSQVRIVHGDKGAKVALQQAFLANGINAIIAS